MCNKLIFGLAFHCLLSFLPLTVVLSLWGRMDVIEKQNKTPLDLSNTDCKNNGNKLQKQSAYVTYKIFITGKGSRRIKHNLDSPLVF